MKLDLLSHYQPFVSFFVLSCMFLSFFTMYEEETPKNKDKLASEGKSPSLPPLTHNDLPIPKDRTDWMNTNTSSGLSLFVPLLVVGNQASSFSILIK